MHIVHVCNWLIPVDGYGGSSRVVYWLAKAQAEQGEKVTIIGPPGCRCPGTTCVPVSAPNSAADLSPYLEALLPADADVVHFNRYPAVAPRLPWVLTVHGNSPGELVHDPHKIFVSQNHAQRAGSVAFVHNGIDPDDYIFRERKADYFLFLSKVDRRSKGIDVALQLARDSGIRLIVAGGSRLGLLKTGGLWNSLRANVQFVGEVSGQRKAELLAGARALLFPIRWEEPFGLVVTEALASGTPVITAPRGAMPELLTPKVGFLCDTYASMLEAIRCAGDIRPADCRQHVLDHLTDHHAADAYRRHYQAAIAALQPP